MLKENRKVFSQSSIRTMKIVTHRFLLAVLKENRKVFSQSSIWTMKIVTHKAQQHLNAKFAQEIYNAHCIYSGICNPIGSTETIFLGKFGRWIVIKNNCSNEQQMKYWQLPVKRSWPFHSLTHHPSTLSLSFCPF